MTNHEILSLTKHLEGLFQKHYKELYERLDKLERGGRSKQHSHGDRKRGKSKNEIFERVKTRDPTYPSSYLRSRDIECSECLRR